MKRVTNGGFFSSTTEVYMEKEDIKEVYNKAVKLGLDVEKNFGYTKDEMDAGVSVNNFFKQTGNLLKDAVEAKYEHFNDEVFESKGFCLATYTIPKTMRIDEAADTLTEITNDYLRAMGKPSLNEAARQSVDPSTNPIFNRAVKASGVAKDEKKKTNDSKTYIAKNHYEVQGVGKVNGETLSVLSDEYHAPAVYTVDKDTNIEALIEEIEGSGMEHGAVDDTIYALNQFVADRDNGICSENSIAKIRTANDIKIKAGKTVVYKDGIKAKELDSAHGTKLEVYEPGKETPSELFVMHSIEKYDAFKDGNKYKIKAVRRQTGKLASAEYSREPWIVDIDGVSVEFNVGLATDKIAYYEQIGVANEYNGMLNPEEERKRAEAKPIVRQQTFGSATPQPARQPAKKLGSLDSYKELLAGSDDYKKTPTESPDYSDLGTEDPEDDFEDSKESLEAKIQDEPKAQKEMFKRLTVEDKAEDAEQ